MDGEVIRNFRAKRLAGHKTGLLLRERRMGELFNFSGFKKVDQLKKEMECGKRKRAKAASGVALSGFSSAISFLAWTCAKTGTGDIRMEKLCGYRTHLKGELVTAENCCY